MKNSQVALTHGFPVCIDFEGWPSCDQVSIATRRRYTQNFHSVVYNEVNKHCLKNENFGSGGEWFRTRIWFNPLHIKTSLDTTSHTRMSYINNSSHTLMNNVVCVDVSYIKNGVVGNVTFECAFDQTQRKWQVFKCHLSDNINVRDNEDDCVSEKQVQCLFSQKIIRQVQDCLVTYGKGSPVRLNVELVKTDETRRAQRKAKTIKMALDYRIDAAEYSYNDDAYNLIGAVVSSKKDGIVDLYKKLKVRAKSSNRRFKCKYVPGPAVSPRAIQCFALARNPSLREKKSTDDNNNALGHMDASCKVTTQFPLVSLFNDLVQNIPFSNESRSSEPTNNIYEYVEQMYTGAQDLQNFTDIKNMPSSSHSRMQVDDNLDGQPLQKINIKINLQDISTRMFRMVHHLKKRTVDLLSEHKIDRNVANIVNSYLFPSALSDLSDFYNTITVSHGKAITMTEKTGILCLKVATLVKKPTRKRNRNPILESELNRAHAKLVKIL